jgi:hypothetical protein
VASMAFVEIGRMKGHLALRNYWTAMNQHKPIFPTWITVLVAATAVACAATLVESAFAQEVPGVPNGVLQDQFHFNEHPQLEFPASSAAQAKPKTQRRTGRGRVDAVTVETP